MWVHLVRGLFVCLLVFGFLWSNTTPAESKLGIVPSKTFTKTLTSTRTLTATITQTRTVTPSSTVTQTQTPSSSPTETNTSSPTITSSPTETLSPTITSSPTVTLTPSKTPVSKTEIKVFDNAAIGANRRIVSDVFNVEEYNEVSLFLYSKTWGSTNKATCFFIPKGASTTERYFKTVISVAVRDAELPNSDLAVNFGRVIGPRMVCEVQNGGMATNIDLYLYLIP